MKLFNSRDAPTFQRLCTAAGVKPRHAPEVAPEDTDQVETHSEAFQALSSFPRVTVAVHLIRIHKWCKSVMHASGGLSAAMYATDAPAIALQASGDGCERFVQKMCADLLNPSPTNPNKKTLNIEPYNNLKSRPNPILSKGHA